MSEDSPLTLKRVARCSLLLVALFLQVSETQAESLGRIGVLSTGSATEVQEARVLAMLDGIASGGYVDGRNVSIQYRWAESRNEGLPGLGTELLDTHPDLLIALDSPSAWTLKALTRQVPIVFYSGADPVETGLVSALRQPGENLTGVSGLTVELASKRLELLHEVVPDARQIVLLVNPKNGPTTKAQVSILSATAAKLDLVPIVLGASSEADLEQVFSELDRLGHPPMLIGADPFLTRQSPNLAKMALVSRVATINQYRDFAEAGGLISYGGSLIDSYHLVGTLAARVLKGDKPATLPIQQSTKIDLILNLRTARSLGMSVPIAVIGRASDIIE